MSYRRVQVTWLDTREEPPGWKSLEDIVPEVAIAKDMGLLIHKTANIIVLAGSHGEDSTGVEVGRVIHIPLGCVTAIEDI